MTAPKSVRQELAEALAICHGEGPLPCLVPGCTAAAALARHESEPDHEAALLRLPRAARHGRAPDLLAALDACDSIVLPPETQEEDHRGT